MTLGASGSFHRYIGFQLVDVGNADRTQDFAPGLTAISDHHLLHTSKPSPAQHTPSQDLNPLTPLPIPTQLLSSLNPAVAHRDIPFVRLTFSCHPTPRSVHHLTNATTLEKEVDKNPKQPCSKLSFVSVNRHGFGKPLTWRNV
nr:hypothetical protein L204_03782 [Cryptococcus depauperatus CBS 7855]